MLVFRIEHITSGTGVYNSGGAQQYDIARDWLTHPSAYDQRACPAPNMWSAHALRVPVAGIAQALVLM